MKPELHATTWYLGKHYALTLEPIRHAETFLGFRIKTSEEAPAEDPKQALFVVQEELVLQNQPHNQT